MKKYNLKDALEKKKIIAFSVGPKLSSKEIERLSKLKKNMIGWIERES